MHRKETLISSCRGTALTERERLLKRIAAAIEEAEKRVNQGQAFRFQGPISHQEAAEAALQEFERPLHKEDEVYIICTCGQNGYSGHLSNHPHREGCPLAD